MKESVNHESGGSIEIIIGSMELDGIKYFR